MTDEDDKYKELDPDQRDWEYDGCGKKRHKKAFHLQYDEPKPEEPKKED
jgi:hypothetical protein